MFLQVPLKIYSDDDDGERYVGGIVLEPGDDNAYGDLWESDDIRLMAHRFMEKSQHVDYMHTSKVVAVPVESVWFPPEAEGGQATYKFYGEEIAGGSWWLGTRVQDDEAWAQVKNGELTGFSIFAVKTPGLEQAANRAYAGPGAEAPPGRKMSATEWDVTMVALVDQPAVRKAVFMKMRRDPTAGIAYRDPTGVALGDPIKELVGQMVETMISTKGEGTMKFKQFLRYVAGESAEGAPDPDPVTDPDPNAAPDGDGSEDGSSDGDQGGQTTPITLESIGETLAKLVAAPADIAGQIATALSPFDERLKLIEGRQNRQAGANSLPGGNALPNEKEGKDDDDDEGKDGKDGGKVPSWANYGTKASKSPHTR